MSREVITASSRYSYEALLDTSKSFSGKELLPKWDQDAKAAFGVIGVEVIQIWKYLADTVVYVIATFEGGSTVEVHDTTLTHQAP